MDTETAAPLDALREQLSRRSSAAERAVLLEQVVKVFYHYRPGPAEPDAASDDEQRAIVSILDRVTAHLHATQFTRN